MMVKRKLVGTLDESSVDQEIRKSHMTVVTVHIKPVKILKACT